MQNTRAHLRELASGAILFLSLGCSTPLGTGAGVNDCEPPAESDMSDAEAEATPYYTMPGLDHGLIQSPVNILSDRTEAGTHTVHLAFERRGTRSIVNKGHTVELGFPRGLSITFDDQNYSILQTHFHTPSEHRIDGITFPMEMHVVSTAPPLAPGAPPEYLVVGLLFKMGKASPFIDAVLRAVPTSVGDVHATQALSVADLFEGGDQDAEQALQSFFHYRGSLTTPPYSETVEWLVLKRVFEASPEQIQAINAIEGDNARPIQMLFGRTVDGE
jgi:carbonic anhydrase